MRARVLSRVVNGSVPIWVHGEPGTVSEPVSWLRNRNYNYIGMGMDLGPGLGLGRE